MPPILHPNATSGMDTNPITPNKKRRSSDGDPQSVNSFGQELLLGDTSFKPISFLSDSWIKPSSTTKMISLIVCLPSGVRKFFVRVVDDGNYVELKVEWPGPLVDPEWLFRKFLSSGIAPNGDKIPPTMEPYHPKILALQAALRKFREHSSESIYSHARFSLPFQCQPTIEKCNFAYKDCNSLVVVCDMTAFVDQYDIQEDKDDFVVS